MPAANAAAHQALWDEIAALDGTAMASSPRDDAASALARRISRLTRGFPRIELLEALHDKVPGPRLFVALWTLHDLLGLADLRLAGLLEPAPNGGEQLRIQADNRLALLAAGQTLVNETRYGEALSLSLVPLARFARTIRSPLPGRRRPLPDSGAMTKPTRCSTESASAIRGPAPRQGCQRRSGERLRRGSTP